MYQALRIICMKMKQAGGREVKHGCSVVVAITSVQLTLNKTTFKSCSGRVEDLRW